MPEGNLRSPQEDTAPDLSAAADAGRGVRWYAVQCQPHRERSAELRLVDQGYRTFLPCRKKVRRHARKVETVRAPFFSGYLFVRLDLARDRWRSINGTVGVVRLVMQGDRPAPAPHGVVEALVAACDESGCLQGQGDLTVGQPVRVLAGPFADFVGQLERMTDAGRVCVLLDIMGGRTPVFLPRGQVAPTESPP